MGQVYTKRMNMVKKIGKMTQEVHENKYVLRGLLKVVTEVAFFRVRGGLFHNIVAATENALIL